jgi:hypothetical protein
MAVEHEIAQGPVAAAKIRRGCPQIDQPSAWRGCSLTHTTHPLPDESEAGHHVGAVTALDRSRCQGREPAERVERSESLDDGEASARISGVMGSRNFGVEAENRCGEIQRMVPRLTGDRQRGPLRRSIGGAVLASRFARVDKRPRETATKILL